MYLEPFFGADGEDSFQKNHKNKQEFEDEVDVDTIGKLLNIAPKPEEMKKIEPLTPADMEGQSPAVKFFYRLKDFPRYEERLTCWVTKLEFKDACEEVCTATEIISECANGIKQNEGLAGVLQIVLALGNYLNIGSQQAGAKGIRIQDLEKLTALKGADGSSLLDWATDFVYNKDPDLCEFPATLPNIKNVLAIDLPALEKEVGDLERRINQCERAQKKEKIAPNDGLPKVLEKFLKKGKKVFADTQAAHNQAQEDLKELLGYFGEVPDAGTEATAWLTSLTEFVQNFGGSVERLKKKKADAEKAEKAAKKKAGEKK